jgi:hypothetical protein
MTNIFGKGLCISNSERRKTAKAGNYFFIMGLSKKSIYVVAAGFMPANIDWNRNRQGYDTRNFYFLESPQTLRSHFISVLLLNHSK